MITIPFFWNSVWWPFDMNGDEVTLSGNDRNDLIDFEIDAAFVLLNASHDIKIMMNCNLSAI